MSSGLPVRSRSFRGRAKLVLVISSVKVEFMRVRACVYVCVSLEKHTN